MSVSAVQARIAEIQGRFGVPTLPVTVSTQVAPAPSPTFDEQLDVARATTWGSTGTAAPTVPGATSPLSAQRSSGATAPDATGERVVALAKQHLGTPYVWGGESPGGFDCSGLMQYAYAAAGVSLPHSSRMQSQMGTPVSRSDLQPGDLVFFYSPVSHVGIYIGNGQMVHAPTSGDVVKVASIDSMGGYAGARRVA